MRRTLYNGPAQTLRKAGVVAFAAAAASLLPAPAAPAGYVQLTQTRSLTTSASANAGPAPSNDADAENSDALGAFDRSITSSASASSPIPNPPFTTSASGSGMARQSVQLAPTSISGSLVGNTLASGIVAVASATATSTWSTTFRVDQPTPFDLGGLLSVRYVSNIGFTGGNHDASLGLSRHADGGGPEQALYSVGLNSLQGFTASGRCRSPACWSRATSTASPPLPAGRGPTRGWQ